MPMGLEPPPLFFILRIGWGNEEDEVGSEVQAEGAESEMTEGHQVSPTSMETR